LSIKSININIIASFTTMLVEALIVSVMLKEFEVLVQRASNCT
jgi:hypothetical protein